MTQGLTVTAEGPETESRADRLRALGCERGQGFYFSRPVPAEDLEEVLERDATLPA